MPITLNHSNISVQYSSDKSYIIETVKSDLYRRNELIDTIVRDNIQVAPVTPTTYVDSGNVYAVESYTYTGSANTADFTRVFTKSTTCDILVVGGGGGGGYFGGGGGGGAILFANNLLLNAGSYTIKVGKGGTGVSAGSQNGTNGIDSSIIINAIEHIAKGGGGGGSRDTGTGGGRNGVAGGSGGGGSHSNTTTQGLGGASNKNTYANWLSYGNNGGNGRLGISGSEPTHAGGGGGGAGSVGQNTSLTTGGGNGGSGLNFSSTFGTSVGHNGWFGGGGGGVTSFGAGNPGYGNGGNGLFGGGGNGGFDGGTELAAQEALPNTGGGGGGAKYDGGTAEDLDGGDGGSGIVIIRYLLGTIPTTNYLTNEPVVIAPVFTETIRSFTHSGGAEAQTTHTITVGQNTICDILMIGGGGGGGNDRAGGGGSGALILSIGNILSGTYTIKVGNKGLSSTAQGVSAQNGFDSEIVNSVGTTIFRAKGGGGGGFGGQGGISGGSGGGTGSSFSGLGGNAVNTNIVSGITTGPVITTSYGVYGNIGGRNSNTSSSSDTLDGAGGGGIGQGGSTSGSLVPVDTQFVVNNGGKGGDGLYFATINGVVYNFKDYFNVNGIQDGTTGNFFIGGGGGGGDLLGGVAGIGGKGGGGAGGEMDTFGINASGFGSGGGGGGGRGGFYIGTQNGGNGSAGIVAIKFRTIVNAGILEGITHKRLNFVFDRLGFSFDATKSVEYQAQQKTGVGGWRIVRYLPPNLGRWYQGDYISTSTFNIPTIGTPYNYTNEWAVSFGTFDEMFFATFDMTYWLHCLKTSVLGTYNNGARPIIKSSFSSTPYTALWYNRATGAPEDPWIRIVQEDNSSIVYGENNNPDHSSLRNAYGGMCVLVRDSTSSTTISNPNQYTLNFQVPTIADINNNSNIVLRGAYDIALTTTNAVITPKTGQYIPKPTTFTNYTIERMYPPVRNFTAATTAVSGQTYGNGTYVVSYSSTYGSGSGYDFNPYTCFNTSELTGGVWSDNRYTAGNFNSTSFIVEGYLGDWLKIQLPIAIKLTRFEILMRTNFGVTGIDRAPKDFKIYGSNDNITWVELVNKTDAVYNASYIYEQTTPEISNTYTYYGLVVNKLFGTGAVLNFDEWYIYGQELLQNSLSIRYNLLNPILDPAGAQWTYSSNNTNVYHMGSVGIGTTNPEYQLDVRGFIFTSVGGYTQTGSENWVVQSDRRIKENIVKASYEKCLDNVKKIELYNFNFKDNCVNTNDKNQLGFIAQEVQQVYPKAVEVGRMTLDNNQGINDLLTLNTTQIKYTLYGAVKNLIERVENIESRVEQIYNMTLSSNIKSSSSNISITFITPLTPNITTNTSNITTNTSNITTNSSNISTNTSNITANTSNITTNSSNITINTSNITTNTSNITTNTSNITANTSNITANTSNITANTSNITTNSSNITANTSNITANTSNITTNSSNITANTSNITTNSSNTDTSNIDTSNTDTSNIDTSNIDTSNIDTSNI